MYHVLRKKEGSQGEKHLVSGFRDLRVYKGDTQKEIKRVLSKKRTWGKSMYPDFLKLCNIPYIHKRTPTV